MNKRQRKKDKLKMLYYVFQHNTPEQRTVRILQAYICGPARRKRFAAECMKTMLIPNFKN